MNELFKIISNPTLWTTLVLIGAGIFEGIRRVRAKGKPALKSPKICTDCPFQQQVANLKETIQDKDDIIDNKDTVIGQMEYNHKDSLAALFTAKETIKMLSDQIEKLNREIERLRRVLVRSGKTQTGDLYGKEL